MMTWKTVNTRSFFFWFATFVAGCFVGASVVAWSAWLDDDPVPTTTVTATQTPVSAAAAVTGVPTTNPMMSASTTEVTGMTYFISPSGNDSADGRSPETAWKTFANVSAPKVPDGATILAQAGGVWTETITVRRENLTFGVYGDGARPKIIAPPSAFAFNGGSRVGTQLIGYEFTGTTRQGGRYGLLYIGAIGDNPAGRYVVRDIVAHGVDGYLLTARGVGGLIENSLFYDSNGSGGTVAVSVGGWEGDGPPPADSTTIFRNNTVRDTGYRAVANWGGNVRIEGNTLERWTAPDLIGNATQAPAGIYVTSRFQGGVVVTGNSLVGTGVEYRGIWVDYGPNSGTVIEGNTISNVQHCFSAENTDGVVFRGNTCANIGDLGVQWVAGSVGGQITGNSFVGPKPPRDWILIQEGAAATVEENTFSESQDAGGITASRARVSAA